MLFSLFTSLIDSYSFFNVFKYITFRTGVSLITSLAIVFIIGGPLIRTFSYKKITGPIRQDGPIDHIVKKSGTPTMGALMVLVPAVLSAAGAAAAGDAGAGAAAGAGAMKVELVKVTTQMVDHKFGEFAFTRKPHPPRVNPKKAQSIKKKK